MPRVRSRFVRRLGRAAGAVLVILSMAMAYVGISGSTDETGPADVALVLGFALDDRGAPRAPLLDRLDHAVDLQRRGIVPRLILAGGVPKAGHTEAGVMRELAVARGVPAEAVIVEDRSRSTVENFACARPILDALGARRVLVVTEPWHMRRALLLGRRHGIDVLASPATGSGRKSLAHAAVGLYREANVFVFEAVRGVWAAPGSCGPARKTATQAR